MPRSGPPIAKHWQVADDGTVEGATLDDPAAVIRPLGVPTAMHQSTVAT